MYSDVVVRSPSLFQKQTHELVTRQQVVESIVPKLNGHQEKSSLKNSRPSGPTNRLDTFAGPPAGERPRRPSVTLFSRRSGIRRTFFCVGWSNAANQSQVTKIEPHR